MSALLTQRRRPVVLFLSGSLLVLILFTLSSSRSTDPSSSSWTPSRWRPRPKETPSPVVPVNHNDDDDFKGIGAGDGGDYHPPKEKKPPAHNQPSTAHPGTPNPDDRLARTDEETTIPSYLPSPSSDPVPAHVYGFTVLDKLYLRNGTFYVVTRDKKRMPEREKILSKVDTPKGAEGWEVPPTDQELRFIRPEEAKDLLGEYAIPVRGVTMMLYDPVQFMTHYYHFWGEIIIGAWRVYSTLGFGHPGGVEGLPVPTRWVMPFVEKDAEWRDRAGLDGPLMRLAFPGTSMESAWLWKDWKKAGTTLVFERTVVVNRATAHKSPLAGMWFKMIAPTMELKVPDGWFEPLRTRLTRNLLGYAPKVRDDGKPEVQPKPAPETSRLSYSSSDSESSLSGGGDRNKNKNKNKNLPIVTYISRQKTGRRLIDADHALLVEELMKLEEEGVCEVRMPVMERLTLQEQIGEVASSTIVLGVHGNGLTHQLWMPPSLRSAVIEMVYPPAYIFDYEMLARNVGHKHYLVRNDSMLTYKPGEYHDGVNFPDEFHGDHIPVYGPFVADLIRKRLTQRDEEVEA